MNVIRADVMGLCFGVRDALQTADAQPQPERITIHGELVHNEHVLRRLRERGYSMSAGPGYQVPATETVLITAHGVSQSERRRLAASGKQILDTTCPLVERAHSAARRLARTCDLIVVIGRRDHVEVRGVTDDLSRFDVVADPLEVRRYEARSIGVLCQTTFPMRRAKLVLAAIERANPDAVVRFADTVCEPTKQRIRAVERLAHRVPVVVVVGGAQSNNTKELVSMCEEAGARTYHVQGPGDLRADWFGGCSVAGLTAGTSTPDEVIEAVYDALRAFDPPALPVARASEGASARERA